MKRNKFGYLIREGVRGIFLHGFMSFAAVCVTVACLIIMGSFSLILYNLSVMVTELEQENEMIVYIDETYTEDQAKSVGSQINMIGNVHNAQFISREEALKNFVEEQNDPDAFAGLQSDTLRDRFVITLEDNTLMRQTENDLRQIQGVADVSAHYEISEGFTTLQHVLRIASVAIIAVLLVVSLLIISNTVKLAMYDRKDEIAVMRMVGATNGFIRMPYVVEGFLLGMFGAAVAFFLEWGLYKLVAERIASVDTLRLFTVVPFSEVLYLMIAAYAITGFMVGVFGSLLSIRKFLNV
ncbi:permease-like cell division protein FtsX [Candidatus Avoscillospira sp. LCP25S3_F1]|uniref:permease-like cell division protein FtsX n=1 Tax=Candidatus Avoscillospira sp. LCP25S3_F1 TaxID=3438825 RepID=UPI003F8E88BC